MDCPLCRQPLPDPSLEGFDRLHGGGDSSRVRECPRCELGVTELGRPVDDLSDLYPEDYGPYRAPTGALARAIARLRELRADRSLAAEPFRRVVAHPPGRILDVGCGRGDLGAALRRRGWRSDGLEPSATAVEAARAQGVNARVGSLSDIPADFTDYDAIVFNHSLEHVPDPLGDLRLAAERLRPDGVLCISVPAWDSAQRRWFGSRWFHLDLPRHLHHFSAGALQRALTQVGLETSAVARSASLTGFWGSVQYLLFGRCVFRGRVRQAALGLAALLWPATAVAGRVSGGDILHVVAHRVS